MNEMIRIKIDLSSISKDYLEWAYRMRRALLSKTRLRVKASDEQEKIASQRQARNTYFFISGSVKNNFSIKLYHKTLNQGGSNGLSFVCACLFFAIFIPARL